MCDAKDATEVYQGECSRCSDEALVREMAEGRVCKDCFETIKDQLEEWEALLEDGEHAIKIDGDRYWRITEGGEWEQDYKIGPDSRTRNTSAEFNAHMQIGTAYLQDEAEVIPIEQHPMTEGQPNPFL